MNEERTTEDVLPQLRDLAETGEWAKSVALLAALHPADLAANIFVTGTTDILSFLLFLGLAAIVIERIV